MKTLYRVSLSGLLHVMCGDDNGHPLGLCQFVQMIPDAKSAGWEFS